MFPAPSLESIIAILETDSRPRVRKIAIRRQIHGLGLGKTRYRRRIHGLGLGKSRYRRTRVRVRVGLGQGFSISGARATSGASRIAKWRMEATLKKLNNLKIVLFYIH